MKCNASGSSNIWYGHCFVVRDKHCFERAAGHVISLDLAGNINDCNLSEALA